MGNALITGQNSMITRYAMGWVAAMGAVDLGWKPIFVLGFMSMEQTSGMSWACHSFPGAYWHTYTITDSGFASVLNHPTFYIAIG